MYIYVSEFFLEWEKFQKRFVEKIKTHFMFNNIFSENCAVYENVEKYGTDGQDTDDNITRRMRFECWINKTIDRQTDRDRQTGRQTDR
jgi:replication initiation and membrane attachment protein DnaB